MDKGDNEMNVSTYLTALKGSKFVLGAFKWGPFLSYSCVTLFHKLPHRFTPAWSSGLNQTHALNTHQHTPYSDVQSTSLKFPPENQRGRLNAGCHTYHERYNGNASYSSLGLVSFSRLLTTRTFSPVIAKINLIIQLEFLGVISVIDGWQRNRLMKAKQLTSVMCFFCSDCLCNLHRTEFNFWRVDNCQKAFQNWPLEKGSDVSCVR